MCSRGKTTQSGMSLIELIITIALVAILASLGTGSYLSYLARGDRATAISDIVKISQALERYYTFNRSYTSSFEDLSMSSSDVDNFYTYSISSGGQSFTIFAMPDKSKDKWILSINELGFKSHYPKASTPPSGKIEGWP